MAKKKRSTSKKKASFNRKHPRHRTGKKKGQFKKK